MTGAGDGEGIRRRILGQGGAGPQGGAAADRYRGDELGVGTDKDVILDDGLPLVGAIVVAGDG